jgi:phage terminase large subunit-like protein
MPSLASALARELEAGWSSVARPNQLPPDGDWSIWLLLAGRGFGKTRAAAEWVRSQVESGSAKNVAIVGATAADVRDTCV